jgi:hypothetical protein
MELTVVNYILVIVIGTGAFFLLPLWIYARLTK